MNVIIDRERCLGTGMCALAIPEVFDQDDEEGLVVLLDEQPPADLHSSVETAAATCPVSAITIT